MRQQSDQRAKTAQGQVRVFNIARKFGTLKRALAGLNFVCTLITGKIAHRYVRKIMKMQKK